MLTTWPPPLPAVVRRLSDAGLLAWPVPGEPEVYAVADGDGREVRIRVRGNGPRDLVERVWRALDAAADARGDTIPQ